MYTYKTIENPIEEIVFKEKGSKFISFAFPVQDLQEVKKCLERVHKAHPKATHHCYAYRLGLKGEQYRANDDGEPSGSAGLPIYNQLLSYEVTQILVIVVRYYGGTKLGVSGLIKAYKTGAVIALEECRFIEKDEEFVIVISTNAEDQHLIYSLLQKLSAKISRVEFDSKTHTTATLLKSQEKDILEKLSGMPSVEFKML